ncbi:MAG: c-type cytochrome [Elusimicrobia bacterium]|nr:c-type cytochrome [Elusimicrobiota bacterium]
MRSTLWAAGAALLAAALAMVLATRRDLEEPHWRLFSEMATSQAPRTYDPSALFADGRSYRLAPPGTVSRAGAPARELKNPVPPSFEALARGRAVYESSCRHCHGPKGRGDGPVAKAVTAFAFPVATNSALELSDAELFRIISHGRNNMPAHARRISEEDRWKLVHALRDLQRGEVARLGPGFELHEDPRRLSLVSADYGRELFVENCATCHGADGRLQKPGVPTLNSPATLAVADDAYYADIILHGRKGTQMPPWKDALTPTQVRSLLAYMRSWQKGVDRSLVLASRGEAKRGAALFRGHCAGCHGVRAEGGIGVSLDRPSFLGIASDQYLRDTILTGRKHTAMPAAYDFSPADVADLIAFLRGLHPLKSSFSEVRSRLPSASKATGAKLYAGRCAGCHGKDGEGGLGSVLASDSFLAMADDRFLYKAVTEGRPGTGMPAWRQLSSEDVADLLAHLRGWQKSPPLADAGGRRRGNPEFGKFLYDKGCVSCHGSEGQGGVGGQLANPVFLASASDEFLWRTVAYGKQGSAMRGFLKGLPAESLMPMESSDIEHVVAYLRSLGERPRVDPLKRTFAGASAAVGKLVFEGKGGCAKCHGAEGEGASGPSLTTPGFLRAASDGFIAASMVLGREGTEMRSFYKGGNVDLTEQDVKDVSVYLRTFEDAPTSRRRRVERNPAAAAEGRTLYAQNCAACHGADGKGARDARGGYAPSLNSPEFLAAADDGFLLATIALGRPNTAMRPFSKAAGGVSELSAGDLRRIVAFIRSWEAGK